MRLKRSGQALICSAIVLLALGIMTSGIVFYAFLAIAVAVLAIDYLRCRALLRDLVSYLTVSRRVGECPVPGSPVDVAYDLDYTGNRSFVMRCIQPPGPLESTPAPATEVYLTKGVQTVRFRVMPAKFGECPVPGLLMVVQSSLFQGTVSGGGDHPANIRIPLGGMSAMARGRMHLSSLPIIGLEVTSHRGGCDFAGVRGYLPGDSIRHVDWARSSKSNLPVVREFEETRIMPMVLLIDTDASMRAGVPRSQMDSAVQFALHIAQEVLSNYERVGLSCFSREEISCFLAPGSGKTHQARLTSTLLSLEATGDTPARPLAMPTLGEAVHAGTAFARSPDLQPLLAVMGGAVDRFSASILEEGFVKAVHRVSKAGTQCHLVILTNLSMGTASLLNGIRLARYGGHRATVMLLPPDIWYSACDQADPDVFYDLYRQVRHVVSLLRSMNVRVIEVCPADEPGSVSPGYQPRNSIRRL